MSLTNIGTLPYEYHEGKKHEGSGEYLQREWLQCMHMQSKLVKEGSEDIRSDW